MEKRVGSRSMKEGGSDKMEEGPTKVRVWRVVWNKVPPTLRVTIWELGDFDLRICDWEFRVANGGIFYFFWTRA